MAGDARGPGEWRDSRFRIRGPAVDGLRAAFVQNWGETGRPLFDPRVDRSTAYFVPDDAICRLLARTAQRGVEVDVLLPGPHVDKRFVQLAATDLSHSDPVDPETWPDRGLAQRAKEAVAGLGGRHM